jgi:hypothetical protein
VLLISCKGALLGNVAVMKDVHPKQSAMEDATIITVTENILIGKDVGPQGAIVSYKDGGDADFTGCGESFQLW